MKTFWLFAGLIVTVFSASCQDFEGKIVYKKNFTLKNKAAANHLNEAMGTREEYFIKNVNYKSIMDGKELQWQLYINKDNRIYHKYAQSATIFYTDASIKNDEILGTKLTKNVIEILGYSCDELILTTKSGIQKYYFSPKFPVNANAFSRHRFGNYSDYMTLARAIPLKMIIENNQFIEERIAIEISPLLLNDKEFMLPANAAIEPISL